MIIKLSLQSKEYLRDLEIFVRFRLHSSYPLREICDVTKTERKECHESYNHLVHLRNPETEEKWRLENLINHAWQQYVDLYTEGKEREYRDLIGLIGRIADYIFKESPRAKKGIGEAMGGQVLELESERLERLIREGCEAAREEGRVDFVTQLLRDGKYNATEISQIFGVPMEQIMRIRKEKNL